MAGCGPSLTFTAHTKSFSEQISLCSRNLSLGLLDPALEAAELAVATAATPDDRALAAVMHIQCLEEAERSVEALETAVAATANHQYTALTNDLVLTAASLALHRNARDEAERMLEAWLTKRLDGNSDMSSGDERVAQLVRLYALRVTLPEFGVARANEILRRAAELVSEEDFGAIRSEILASSEGTAQSSMRERRQASRSLVTLRGRRVMLHRDAVADMVQSLGRRLRCWISGCIDSDAKVFALVGSAAVALWLVVRTRGRGQSLPKLLWTSVQETFKIALGSGTGRWIR
jgi:hypothetical protein